jgi:hypothetical protein
VSIVTAAGRRGREETTFERVAVELDRDMTDLLQNETTVQKGGCH